MIEVAVMLSRNRSFLLWTGALARALTGDLSLLDPLQPGMIGKGPAPPGLRPISPTWVTLARRRVPGWHGDGT